MAGFCAITICLIYSIIYTILIFKKKEKINLEKEEEQKQQIQNEINSLQQEKDKVFEEVKQIQERRTDQKTLLDNELELFESVLKNSSDQYIQNIENQYSIVEKEFDNKKYTLNQKIEDIEQQIQDAENNYKELQGRINAAVKAHLRERRMEEKLEFYKLHVSSVDLEDIEKLNTVKLTLHNPVILSKLIWTTYFQKQTTELCNRVFGVNTVCGIYKITNIKTHQCYIGQSLDIQSRIKQHIKCGLGIDAPTTNKLYSSMQKDGVWNYTFELLEECPKAELNEAEKRWIKLYESNDIGYNSTAGNR